MQPIALDDDSDEDLSFLDAGPSTGLYTQNKRQNIGATFTSGQDPTRLQAQQESEPAARSKKGKGRAQVSQGLAADLPSSKAKSKTGRHSDQPHPRAKCSICPFGDTAAWAVCPNCYCYVCAVRAPCHDWGDGSEANDHCLAHEEDPTWKRRHAEAKAVRDKAALDLAGRNPGDGSSAGAQQMPPPQQRHPGPSQVPPQPSQLNQHASRPDSSQSEQLNGTSQSAAPASEQQGDLGRTRGCHPETSASAMDHALAAMGDLAQIGVQQFQAAAVQAAAASGLLPAGRQSFMGSFTRTQLSQLRNQILAFRGLRETYNNVTARLTAQPMPLSIPVEQPEDTLGGAARSPAEMDEESGRLESMHSLDRNSNGSRDFEDAKPFTDADGNEYLQDQSPEEDAALQAVVEGLEQREDLRETTPPPGLLLASLYSYQKRALTWMLLREDSYNVPGGILADEQGLGKTVQMLALIVSNPPTLQDAERALRNSRREQDLLQYHVLGRSARDQRASLEAARLNAGGSTFSPRSLNLSNGLPGVKLEGGPSTGKKKGGRATPLLFTPCGKGKHCRCVICNKARAQKLAAEISEAKKQEKAKREAKRKAKELGIKSGSGASSGREMRAKAPTSATVYSPDGGIAKRTLVVCPLCVANQWKDEIEAKTPQLSVALYHGPDRRERFSPALLASYDVVVTTYDILGHEKNESPMGIIFRVQWFRIILDEAHVIRNKATLSAHACMALQGERRWCLTGTPVVNAAMDVYSLFCFLRYQPFSNIQIFNHQIRNKVQGIRGRRGPSQRDRSRGYRELKIAMSAVTLRRTKNEKVDGRPIIVLPGKVVEKVETRMTTEESSYYRLLESRSQDDFNKFVREGWRQNYHHILVLLLRLRQACIHPYLSQTRAQEHEFSQPQADQAASDGQKATGMKPELKVKLFRKLVASDASECPICMDMAQDGVVSECCHGPFCRECMNTVLQNSDQHSGRGSCPLCRRSLTVAQLYGKEFFDPPKPPSRASPKPTDITEEALTSSTKLQHVIHVLDSFREQDVGASSGKSDEPGIDGVTKTIIFSQFTKALDLLEHELTENGYCFMRLDGSMSIGQRAEAVRTFGKEAKVRILLCSIKAASLGLNLTMANKVILLDCWWNAATEEQAIDRCHRLGQTREVGVVKLVMRLDDGEATVEQRIIEMQEDKKAIADAALGDGSETAGPARLSLEQLRELFGLSSHRKKATSAGVELSDEVMQILQN